MLERENPKPLYSQLRDILRTKIENEEWKPNQLIPSENELSKIYGVSRMTARSVVMQLNREGLVYRVQGKGTFVSEPKITTESLSYMGIREQLEKMGYQTSTQLLSLQILTCSERVAQRLKVSVGTKVYELKRMRYVRGEPLSIHISYMVMEKCPNLESLDLEGEQLCVLLSRNYGLNRCEVIETLESTQASPEEAKLLEIHPKYPLLLLEDIISDSKGKPFEYTIVLFRGDKIKIQIKYNS